MSEGRAAAGRRAAADRAVHADAVPGRGVGGHIPVPVLHRPPDADLGRAVSGDGARVRFLRLESRGARPAGPALSSRPSSTGTSAGTARHASLLAWYTGLIALRRRVPALTDPRLRRVETACDGDLGWLVVRRGPVMVAVNLGVADRTFPAGPDAELLAASDPAVELTNRGLVLPPDTVALVTEQREP